MPVHTHKTRVGLALKEAIHVSKPHSRPEDLEALIKEQHALSKKLHHLVHLLKDQQSSMDKHNDDRLKVIEHVVDMSADAPIFDTVADGKAESKGGETMKSVYKELFVLVGSAQGETSFDDIIAKVTQWEKTISHRINESSNFCLGLRRDLEHYEKKVDEIHSSIESSEEQEKKVSSAMYEKRERNDTKLSYARREYEMNVQDLCAFTKEVTQNAWKDLVPVIVHLIKWDMENTKCQAEIAQKLEKVVQNLTEIAEKHGFYAEKDRIDALKQSPPEELVESEVNVLAPSESENESDGAETPENVVSLGDVQLAVSNEEHIIIEPDSQIFLSDP